MLLWVMKIGFAQNRKNGFCQSANTFTSRKAGSFRSPKGFLPLVLSRLGACSARPIFYSCSRCETTGVLAINELQKHNGVFAEKEVP